METFLGKTAQHIFKNYTDEISDLCIVLPNRRASLFLRKHLAQLFKKNIWSPQIFSIEDFVFELSGLTIIDNTSLLFELYEIHKIITKDKAQEFDEFTKWAQVLVQDFNEIDQHLANAKSIFSYLTDLKELTNWNPEQLEPTEFQKQYISFFQSLYIYYESLNKNLSGQKAAYAGAAYRFVAEHLSEIKKNIHWKKIIFAGFNALSIAEERIIFGLEHDGFAEVLWDADQYFFEKQENSIYPEAGLFLRKHKNQYKQDNFRWIFDQLKTEEKNIRVYGVPKLVGQAKLCGQILSEQPEILQDNHNSAIVLADENLLFPTLNSLPGITELNATMGIPLMSTPIYDFLSVILDLHYKSQMLQKLQQKNKAVFHLKNILKILKHPVINDIGNPIFDADIETFQQRTDELSASNKIFFRADEIIRHFNSGNPLLKLIFQQWDQTETILSNSGQILEIIRDAYILKQKERGFNLKIEIEYVYLFSLVLNKIKHYQSKYKAINSLKSFISFFNQLSKAEKLSLYGEPLQGLQLMGMLETRTLDFKNLILCSVNENTLPGSGKQNSFIPFDIRREYNLPTYREKNAIFAYHFFRLIQRAKNIHLIYNTEADPISGGDKSRFLYQLQEEISPLSNIKLEEQIVSSPLKIGSKQEIVVQKTPEILNILSAKAKKGFSPSSLNTFKRCPLQFYFNSIAKLGEPNEIEEVMDAATLGEIIHDVLQIIYEPLLNQNMEAKYLSQARKNLDVILNNTIETSFKGGEVETGKNLLITKVAKRFLNNFMNHEIGELNKGNKLEILSLEEEFTNHLTIALPGQDQNKQVKFIGRVDRIDRKNGIIRIIDYKTGNVQPNDLKITAFEDIFHDPKTDKSFQLMFYQWLYLKNKNVSETSIPGIYSLKKLSNAFIALQETNEQDIVQKMQSFETGLKQLIQRIFDPQETFSQTEDASLCSYCNYKRVCNK